ncbi:MAG: hypothetical protein K2X43_24720 [Hyphomonadaceae bacterium]|jgi:hypothetical protein|nr:hypothetical protein [Hyphomonadaceae bacterium]
MTPDTAQGLSAELRFALKEGWSFVQEPDRFRIRPPAGSQTQGDFRELMRSEVWRISQFVAYADFVSIARHEDGSYTVVSRSSPGSSFEIVFDVS